MERRIEAGTYRSRAIAGSEQYGTTTNGYDQIVLELDLLDVGERLSTFLIFSDASATYSIDRLRACGWEGEDLTNLTGIDRNEIQVSVSYEMWEGKERMRVQILTGGGRVTLERPMNDAGKRQFAARFRDLAKGSRAPATGNPEGGGSFPYGANAGAGQASQGGGQRPPQAAAGGGRAKF